MKNRVVANKAAWVVAGSVVYGHGIGGCTSGSSSSGANDSGSSGSAVGDSGSSDSGSSDSGSGDSAVIDSGSSDSAVIDSGSGRSGSSGEASSACVPQTSQCAGTGSVQICGSDGQWGSPWTCATASCTDGACTGSTTTGSSCETSGAGRTDCGSASGGSESCCTSLEVPGGTFDRTYVEVGGGAEAGTDVATVSGFRLDRYLVTVGRFRQFVGFLSGGGSPPAGGTGKQAHLNGGKGLANAATGTDYEIGWDAKDWNADVTSGPVAANTWNTNLASCAPYSTWTPSVGAQENLPINCVDWYQAYAFCVWDGGFLPSEAEWEYAAAGGAQERAYPWGSTDPGIDNQYAIYECHYGSGDSGACTGAINIAPVGRAPLGVGRWGQLDLAGNLWEWTLDWYAPYASPCADCAYLSSSVYRVVRGGGYSTVASSLVPTYRSNNAHPFDPGLTVGFRCARTP